MRLHFHEFWINFCHEFVYAMTSSMTWWKHIERWKWKMDFSCAIDWRVVQIKQLKGLMMTLEWHTPEVCAHVLTFNIVSTLSQNLCFCLCSFSKKIFTNGMLTWIRLCLWRRQITWASTCAHMHNHSTLQRSDEKRAKHTQRDKRNIFLLPFSFVDDFAWAHEKWENIDAFSPNSTW